MAARKTLVFVTGNANKLREVKKIMENVVNIESRSMELPELQGDPMHIAVEKCRIAAKAVQGACIVEDTCLCFNALNGLPGPYIKWFLEKVGHDGLNKMLVGFEDKTAYALCTFTYSAGPDHAPVVFEGRTDVFF